jgi:hypothetical protein
MNPVSRIRETQIREPRLLDSRTPGVVFQMTGSIRWEPHRTAHLDVEAVVRDAVFNRAQAFASERYADDVRGTEDAINADLGIRRCESSPFYSGLVATVTLKVSEQGIRHSLEYRNSVAQIQRLHFLKRELYSDPSMLLLDYLDRNPGELADPPDIARFQRLALRISNGDRWWCRILDILDRLSSEVSDKTGNFYVMKILFGALQEAAPDLFAEYQEKVATSDG